MAALVEQSDYFHSLEQDAKKRYFDRISLVDGMDPYILKQQDLFSNLPLLR